MYMYVYIYISYIWRVAFKHMLVSTRKKHGGYHRDITGKNDKRAMQAIQVMTTEDQLELHKEDSPTHLVTLNFWNRGCCVWHDILWITQGFANGVYCTPKRAILMRDKIINPQICGCPIFRHPQGWDWSDMVYLVDVGTWTCIPTTT